MKSLKELNKFMIEVNSKIVKSGSTDSPKSKMKYDEKMEALIQSLKNEYSMIFKGIR